MFDEFAVLSYSMVLLMQQLMDLLDHAITKRKQEILSIRYNVFFYTSNRIGPVV
jgi:hypothetical protein